MTVDKPCQKGKSGGSNSPEIFPTGYKYYKKIQKVDNFEEIPKNNRGIGDLSTPMPPDNLIEKNTPILFSALFTILILLMEYLAWV